MSARFGRNVCRENVLVCAIRLFEACGHNELCPYKRCVPRCGRMCPAVWPYAFHGCALRRCAVRRPVIFATPVMRYAPGRCLRRCRLPSFGLPFAVFHAVKGILLRGRRPPFARLRFLIRTLRYRQQSSRARRAKARPAAERTPARPVTSYLLIKHYFQYIRFYSITILWINSQLSFTWSKRSCLVVKSSGSSTSGVGSSGSVPLPPGSLDVLVPTP